MPGDAYVDWVGFSSFNWASRYKQNVWRNPDVMFDTTLAQLRQFRKPIIIAETASAESNSSQDEAKWILALAKYMERNIDLKAIMWFDTQDNGIDWSVTSTKVSTAAFTKAFDGYFIKRIDSIPMHPLSISSTRNLQIVFFALTNHAAFDFFYHLLCRALHRTAL